MSDNQRRFFCRILFLLVCALPTSLVAYWIGHPQTAGGWELAIKAELGVAANIDSIETPGPNVTILRGLELYDPDAGTLLKTVEARIEFGRAKNFITIPYKVQGLTNQGLVRLVKQMNQTLIRTHGAEKPWRLEFSKESLVQQSDAAGFVGEDQQQNPRILRVAGLTIDIVPAIDGTTATAYFNVPDDIHADHQVVCEISKSEKQSQLVQLDTNQVSLPCWLVADSVDLMTRITSSLGQDAYFAGKLELSPTPGKSKLFIDGTFGQVDLKRSLKHIREPGQQFATIELDECKFVDGVPQKWNAVLQYQSSAMSIQLKDLFVSKWQVAPDNAIVETILQQGYRAAQAESSQWK
jgi:hypothetical protein